MIVYDWMMEEWYDTENPDSKTVPMTPEGERKEMKQRFETWEEFYEWAGSKT